jgi:D-alanyl-D-alanine-carboxypeptidase/D-alanyl-D-alanine-endopeptidase
MRLRRKWHWLFAAFALGTLLNLGCGGGGESKPATAVRDSNVERTMTSLRRVVRARVDSLGSTGVVAGVVFPDGQTRVIAYGDAGAGKRLDASSIFEIGSITKVFTATQLSEMVGRGEVELDDPVARFLPKAVDVPARGGRQIRLVDLATQTSGLPRLPTGFEPKDPDNPYADYTVEQLYEFLSGYTLTRDVGSEYQYSNLGVGLLGHALARRAGKSYEELLRERILEPLGMTMTAIALTPGMRGHFVSGHGLGGEVVPHWDISTLEGAGALRSNVTDMLKFAAANLDRDGGTLQRAMAATHLPRHQIDPEMRIGLNWHIFRPFDRDIVWHNGGTGGFVSMIGLDKARRTAVVVLSNSSASSVDDIGFHLLDGRVKLAPTPKVRKEITLPPQVLERYVGVYQLPQVKATITRSPKGLVAQAEGQGALRIFAESETEFFFKGVDAQITFQRDSYGTVTGFILHEEGTDIRAKKIR